MLNILPHLAEVKKLRADKERWRPSSAGPQSATAAELHSMEQHGKSWDAGGGGAHRIRQQARSGRYPGLSRQNGVPSSPAARRGDRHPPARLTGASLATGRMVEQ